MILHGMLCTAETAEEKIFPVCGDGRYRRPALRYNQMVENVI